MSENFKDGLTRREFLLGFLATTIALGVGKMDKQTTKIEQDNSLAQKYLSTQRQEKLVSVEVPKIDLPEHLIPLEQAIKSLLLEYGKDKNGQPKHVFLAAGKFGEAQETNLFTAVFGRDAMRMCEYALMLSKEKQDLIAPKIVEDCLEFLMVNQGTKTNKNSEEEVGKILHEYRDVQTDPIAQKLQLERGWNWPYYGSIDATAEYIKVLCQASAQNPELLAKNINGKTYLESLNSASDCILGWIKNGLVSTHRMNPNGIEIQSWRDSHDSVSSKKSGQTPNPDADMELFELNFVCWEALESASKYIPDLKQHCDSLKKNILAKFLVRQNSKTYFAMGTQTQNGITTIFDTLASFNLKILNSSFFDEQPELRQQIFQTCHPALKQKNGITTISEDSNRSHPAGYHTGNIWLFDNLDIAYSLLKIGKIQEAKTIFDCVDRVIKYYKIYPEMIGQDGYTKERVVVYDQKDGYNNTIAQPGQPLQGWTVMAYCAMKEIFEKL
jgi:glycogen debranching enzyme